MKVVPETSERRQTVLTIELEPREVEPFLERAYRRIAQRLAIPGFRPGKAPRPLVERLVGREGLLEEALDLLTPEVTQRVVREQDLPLGGTPHVEVVNRNPVTLKATIPLEPVVDLGDYTSIRIPLEPVYATDEDVQRLLEALRRRHTTWESVARPCQVGDMIVASLTGVVEGHQVFQEADLPFVVGESGFLLGQEFMQKLLGANRGEVREFTLPIPADYPDPGLRGKPCAYRVLVKDIKAPVLPAVDDAFARQVDPSVDSLEALKARLKERLQAEKETLQRERYRRRVLEALRQKAQVEVPPLLLEQEVEHLIEHYQEDLSAQGITLERWLQSQGKTLNQMREELYPEAKRRVEERYLLDRIAQVEGIQVTPQEVEAELQGLARPNQRRDRELFRALQEPAGREAVARIIARRKALQRMVQIASQPTTEQPPPPQGGPAPHAQ
ncbi:MAG: trigger factor [Dehalococcoidia bacterium]|nr:trigger factor [Dehalococcoidia bacterium]MDW8119184.1 trigger factor [Chloroflexota bacterium]